MNPSNKEMQLRRNCQLYAYLLDSQGKDVPEEILEAIDDYDYLIDCVVQLSEELESLDSETFGRIVNNPDSQDARELAYWWEMCQEADRLRKVLVSTCA
ncbi:hypothetical protein JHD50_03795 [Sulfurimonas sp. MAG313]|nr:hypothetical protein [Sulfurimonas sp. MAG313]MDF1880434.1 hypothetical protein [Sulfurimonas sp. MAG313]